jgi:cytochrome P450
MLWGDDSLEFKPTRWIPTNSKVGEVISLIQPQRGSYIPWSGGPRVCPGQKMSQVEFVAVISTLFRKARAEAIQLQSESLDAARNRLLDVVMDSAPILTLQMRRPEDIRLRWTAR